MPTSQFLSQNLPQLPTPLVGRDALVRDISELVRERHRLVTLTGPGGIGKTRLAIAVADQLAPAFQGHVALVWLAAIKDGTLLTQAIARQMELPWGQSAGDDDDLASLIGNDRWLIVLDNVEHLIEDSPQLSRLLERCPAVRLLVTSRSRLHIQGEQEVVVPPLTASASDGNDPSSFEEGSASQLFVQRAQTVVPSLTLTADNGPLIAAICNRLDGLPLAIELAAARTKVLPLQTLLGRLDRSLLVLTGGRRDAPDRHRTMRSAIAWSYDLLSATEQTFFRRISVFAGSFSLLEAESIAWLPSGASDARSAIDLLATLIDTSLLMPQGIDGEPRYVMLQTIREFGWELLEQNDELPSVRDQHAAWFVTYAEAAVTRLRGAERLAWLERLERSHSNLRAALTWLCQKPDTDQAIQMAGALWRFWWWRSYLAEGRQYVENVLSLPGSSEPTAFYARALTGRGALAESQGDFGVADASYEEAIQVWQALGDRNELAMSLLFRWLVALNAADERRMLDLSSESLRLFRELDDSWGVAMSLLEQGVLAMVREEFPEGERILDDAIDVFAAVPDPWGLAMSRGVLGNIKSGQGDYRTAMTLLQESLDALLMMDDTWGVATVLLSVARTAAAQGHFEQVARISGAIGNLHDSLGASVKVPFRERYERNLLAAEQSLGRQRFGDLMALGAAMTPAEAVAAAFDPAGAQVSSTTRDDPATPIHSLSRREREVLRLIPGRTAREIGQELFISESTVRTHIEHILNKFGLRTQKELIAYVYKNHLV